MSGKYLRDGIWNTILSLKEKFLHRFKVLTSYAFSLSTHALECKKENVLFPDVIFRQKVNFHCSPVGSSATDEATHSMEVYE